MQFETEVVNCVKCQGRLILESHTKTWQGNQFLHSFVFRCEKCGQEFESTDGKLSLRKPLRDTSAETSAILRAEHNAASRWLCPECGGPTTEGGSGRICKWCHEQYGVVEGELTPKPPAAETKSAMRDFYAVQ
jgi:hypothetical protein